MTLEHREQGQTRQEILALLRRRGEMTATELSERLGIGAVGVRQHMALLERDGLVHTAAVRRGVGRPSHLYALTPAAGAAVGAAAGAAAVGAALPPPVLPAPHAARTPARIAMIMNRLTRFIERVLLISESICQVHRPRVLIA